ncbi:hypothetical protein F3Y22_tig00110729pilonHSYRG00143 [Hibiscus syriacus]|uniref:HXXXD-type acyl-transferase family protein n=1 Tax=Hibiscus syriacus TaxID=106335 RepID=A0A6A2ZTZ6_HIBSY|nr:hypothetical protein F3Y22_tig00110729pilonHSYRG00143 [Hibiscus syriacus]
MTKISYLFSLLGEKEFSVSQNIAQLKAKANSEVGTDNISSLQSLLSHLWRSIVRNKKLNPDEEMTYCMWIGARLRLSNLPQQHFGNSIKSGLITMKAKEVQEQIVGDIAREMNKLVSPQTEQEFRREFESWIKSPKLLTMASIVRNFIETNSSPQFDIYGNDFGWGRPVAIRSRLGNKLNDMLTVFCGAEEGSIDVEVCLLPETLEAMASED